MSSPFEFAGRMGSVGEQSVDPTLLTHLGRYTPVTGTAASLASTNTILLVGQVGYETDTLSFKIGDGVTAYNSLSYQPVRDLTPSGTIIMHGADSQTPPSGYLYCDGSSVLRADYVALYAAIGDAWGTADGTHFNLPDFRGKFPRGKANTSANDPDRAARTAQAAGGNTGDKVGSIQGYATKLIPHTHSFDAREILTTGTIAARSGGAATATLATGGASTTGDNETRPINAYVNFFIKT